MDIIRQDSDRISSDNSQEQAHILLPVQGMHCTGCAQSIEMALHRVSGISEIMVSHPLSQADIAYDPGQVSLGQIDRIIGDLGFSVPSEKISLAVTGMTCTGCAEAVQTALQETDGVLSAQVSFALAQADLEYVAGHVTMDELRSRVARLGYELSPSKADVPRSADTSEVQVQPAPSPQPELRAKLITAFICTGFIFILNMILPLFWQMPGPLHDWTVLGLTTAVQFWVGSEFHRRAWRSLRTGMPGMDTLVSMGSNVAYFTGLATLVLNLDRALFPLFFESAAFIITFVFLGRFLEVRARRQTGDAIQSLMSLQPAMAHVERAEGIVALPLAQVQLQDILVVRAGDTVPVDGTLLDGKSTVDESLLSGESIPVWKQAGDQVWGGTLNQEGTFRFVAEAVGSDTAAARIADTVRTALLSKAPVQSLADRVARVFVPIVISLAAVTGLLWGLLGAQAFYPQASPLGISLMFASAVLLISCPCALGLATPTAMIAGTMLAARRGILVKDASTLQRLADVDTLIFDKTGTVTEGQPRVQEIVLHPDCADSPDDLLALAAGALQGSAHPVSQAIQTAAAEKELAVPSADGFHSHTGLGVEAQVAGAAIRVGSPDFMQVQGLALEAWQDHLRPDRIQGRNITFLARNDQVLGFFAIADTLRPEATQFVQDLRTAGIGVHMLSGDSTAAAEAAAVQMGLVPNTEIGSRMKPEDKARVVTDLQKNGHSVCMVGDGVNDAPALARADVSMAMTSGHNLALETADVGILNPDLTRIPESLRMGQRILRVVRQNLFWAFFYNVAAIPLATGLFVPFLGPSFKLNPAVAAGAMALSSIFVVQNSLRIRRFRS